MKLHIFACSRCDGPRVYGNGEDDPGRREAWLGCIHGCGVTLHVFIERRASTWRPYISAISEMTNARGARHKPDQERASA